MSNGTPNRADQLVALAKPAIVKLTGAGLTSAEEHFLRAVAEGQVSKFSSGKDEDDDPSKASQWKKDRVLRAACIAWVCTDPDAKQLLTHRGILVQGARIDGGLDMEFAKIDVPLRFEKCAFAATMNLSDADIHSLILEGTHTAGIAADGLRVQKNVFLRNGYKAQGEVRLVGASIGGTVDCSNGQFSNPGNRALTADGVEVEGGVFFDTGFKAEGEVRLLGASIGDGLNCRNGHFFNPGNKALSADRIEVKGGVYFDTGFKAEGEVRLGGASIGGVLVCEGGEFSNPGKDAQGNDHYALLANGIRVEGDVCLSNGFKADGEVRLKGASIGGDLNCEKGQFSNPGKDAQGNDRYCLSADGIKLVGSFFFRDVFKAEGKVSLASAEVGGHLQWLGVQSPKTVTLDLRSAKVKTLWDEEASWPPKGQLYLQGSIYEELFHGSPVRATDRIKWLSRQDESFRDLPATATKAEERALFAQPYEQLASVLRKSGLEDEADEVLIEKNKRVAQWTRFCSLRGLWYRVFGPLISYGYRPMVTFWWSLGIIAYGCYLFDLGNTNELISPTHKEAYVERNGKATTEIREDYPRFNSLVYSVETFVPLVNLFQKEYYLPNANRGPVAVELGCVKLSSGEVLRGYLWVHIALGWTLTTIWVAGLTGVIKKRG